MNNTPYQIIAYHPDAPGLYLVSAKALRHSKVPEDVIEMAYVLDTRQGILFPPTPLISLYEHDPWQDYEGDQSLLVDLLKQVKPFEAN
jgi:hypothetical protein